jgi:hypothetical protein
MRGRSKKRLRRRPIRTPWDIYQAYAELGSVEKSIFGLRAGRQELTFGDQRLIGNAAWTDTEHTFDAIRGTVRYKGYPARSFRRLDRESGHRDLGPPPSG